MGVVGVMVNKRWRFADMCLINGSIEKKIDKKSIKQREMLRKATMAMVFPFLVKIFRVSSTIPR